MFQCGDVVTWRNNFLKQEEGVIERDEGLLSVDETERTIRWFMIRDTEDRAVFKPETALTMKHEKEQSSHRYNEGMLVRGRNSNALGIIIKRLTYPQYEIQRLDQHVRNIVVEDQLVTAFDGSVVDLYQIMTQYEYAVRSGEGVDDARKRLAEAILGTPDLFIQEDEMVEALGS